jgi:hypothetical protein
MLVPKDLLATILLLTSSGLSAAATTPTFAPAVTFPVGGSPEASGDFNGDGKIDLVIADDGDPNVADDGSVRLLLGNGDGTFKTATNVAENLNLVSIAIADFNGDQRLDIAFATHSGNTTNPNGSITVLLGNGDATFGDPRTFDVQGDISSFAVGNFDSDLRPDLAVLIGVPLKLTIFTGNGDGSFAAGTDILGFSSAPTGSRILVADLNEDAHSDLVIGLYRRLVTMLGNGDGTFQSPVDAPGVSPLAAGYPVPFSVVDFDGDGKLDLVIRLATQSFGGNNNFVETLLGNGDGTLQPPTIVASDVQGMFPAAGDFNGDGHPDLAITDAFLNQVNLYLGNGDGSFRLAQSFNTSGYPFLVLAVDLTSDQAPELVTENGFDRAIATLLNTTGADFSISASALTPSTVTRGQSSTATLTLAHLNTFEDPVSLSCSVRPAESATCSLNPNSIIFDINGNASATLTVNTGPIMGSLGLLRRESIALQFLWPVAGFALAGAGLGSRRSIRRRVMACILSSILFGGMIFQSACAGSGGPGATTYTVTITGTSASTQHSTTAPLVIR